MGKPIRIAILADGSQAKRELSSTAGATSSFGSKLGTLAKRGALVAAAGLAVAGAAAIKFGKDSVQAASDAQQSLGASEAVFGKYADTVIKRSKKAGQAIGLSANEYRELSNVTGAMLSSAGTPLAKVTDLTDKLNRRAADMAATFGGTTREAVESVTALLRGETDPIERYGVAIKQSDINARLAAKGLDKLEGSALKQAEQQARLELLFRQTARTQGQFARESDTLAGAQQRMGAQWENLKASAGRALVPALTAGANAINREVLPPLIKLSDKYLPKLGREFGNWADSIDFSKAARDAEKFIDGINWKKFGDALADIGDDGGDGLTVLGVGLKFAADNADLLADAMPILVAGFVAYKAAQLANNTVGRDSLIGFGIQTTATLTLARANRQLAASLLQVNAAQGGGIRAATAATAQVSKLGMAARATAGVAGIGAIAASAQTGNRALGVLGTTAGGAALGFSMGGPWGAAIGAVGGLATGLIGLGNSAGDAANEMDGSQRSVTDYTTAVNQLNGSVAKATQALAAQALQQAGAFELARELGISTRDLTLAASGNEAAWAKVNKVFTDQLATSTLTVDAYGNIVQKTGVMSDSAYKLAGILGVENQALQGAQNKTRELSIASGELQRKLQGVKGVSQITSRIETQGWPQAARDVARLTRGLNLTPRQIRTVMRVLGVPASEKQVQKVMRILREFERKNPTSRPKVDGKGATKQGKKTQSDLEKILSAPLNIKPGVTKKPALTQMRELEKALRNTAKGPYSANVKVPTPTKDISGVKTALKNIPDETVWVNVKRRGGGGGGGGGGGNNGGGVSTESTTTPRIIPTDDDLTRSLQRSIETAARRAGPSAQRAGRDIVSKILRGVVAGGSGVSKALDRITKLVQQRVKGKKQEATERRILKNLDDQYDALRRNARAQDKVNKKLQQARDRLAEVKGWADNVRDSFIQTGNITTLGQLEDGTVDSTLMVDQLKQAVVRAQRFAELIRSLRDQGLNKTSLDQLLAAGPEAALSTAEALAQGGASAISEVNDLTKELAAQGGSLGREMSDTFFKVGLSAAEGLVRGLERQSGKLDRAAERIARTLAAKVRQALGIKSPSRVFRSIGDQVVAGLVVGLDDTYVRRQGQVMAASLQEGFARPALEAYARDQAATAAGGGQSIRITLSAAEISQLQRGREIQADLDAYRKAGGRAGG